jgi:hypothetical protein
LTDSLTGALEQEALDFVFSFYVLGHPLRSGRADAQVRRPQILAALGHSSGYFPAKEKTILVTGSKGKGSTARMIAWHLQAAGFKVGLVVSPEELHHLDRIRIQNKPIMPAQFIQCVDRLKPQLISSQALAKSEGHDFYYHSPSDIFMLVAMAWFSTQALDYIVIEGGRGARYDLLGQVPAKIGVVTSVFLEHASFLGADIRAIANDKLSLTANCDQVLAPIDLKPLLAPSVANKVQFVPAKLEPAASLEMRPNWLVKARHMSAVVVSLLGVQATEQWQSPSFSQQGGWILDGAIHPQALDPAVLQRLASNQSVTVAVLLGLPADKAVLAVSQVLNAAGLTQQYQWQLSLGGKDLSEPALAVPSLGRLDLQQGFDPVGIAALQALAQSVDLVYCVGAQLFLRNLRNALHLNQLVGP